MGNSITKTHKRIRTASIYLNSNKACGTIRSGRERLQMNQETPAGHAVEVMNAAASYDAAIKSLLAHKPFLARIMKECLPEYRDCSISDIMNRYIEGDPHVASIGVDVDETNPRIRGGNTEDKTLTEGTIFYDIRFNALAPKGDDLIGVIVNVEAQNRSNTDYPLLKRAIYYCSRMISAQKGVEFTHSDYSGIRKVYSVWICSNVPEAERSSITAYSMKEKQLVGHVVKAPEEYDLLSVVMICLDDIPQSEDGSVDEAELDKNVIGMLEVLLKGDLSATQRKDILEKHYGIEMTEQIEEEVGHMCNLSQGVMERGVAKGRAEGRVEGVDATRIESIKAIMKSMEISLEQAVKLLNYPMSELDKYAAALN